MNSSTWGNYCGSLEQRSLLRQASWHQQPVSSLDLCTHQTQKPEEQRLLAWSSAFLPRLSRLLLSGGQNHTAASHTPPLLLSQGAGWSSTMLALPFASLLRGITECVPTVRHSNVKSQITVLRRSACVCLPALGKSHLISSSKRGTDGNKEKPSTAQFYLFIHFHKNKPFRALPGGFNESFRHSHQKKAHPE